MAFKNSCFFIPAGLSSTSFCKTWLLKFWSGVKGSFKSNSGALTIARSSPFRGSILATISIQGLFKYYAIVSFAVPFLILGLPMFDTLFAIIRRLAHGQNPMAPDRGHIHHRLIDMGLNQKQAVAALYVISSILGLSAVMLTSSGAIKAMLFLMALAVAAFLASRVIFRRDIDKALQAEKAAAEEKSTETATPAETVPAEPEEESNEKKKEEA